MMLIRAGLYFKMHAPIPGLPRRSCDFRVGDTFVFVHGRFWHDPEGRSRRMSAYWRRKVRRNAERDEETRLHLKKLGHSVIVLWDDQFTPRNRWQVELVVRELLRG